MKYKILVFFIVFSYFAVSGQPTVENCEVPSEE